MKHHPNQEERSGEDTTISMSNDLNIESSTYRQAENVDYSIQRPDNSHSDTEKEVPKQVIKTVQDTQTKISEFSPRSSNSNHSPTRRRNVRFIGSTKKREWRKLINAERDGHEQQYNESENGDDLEQREDSTTIEPLSTMEEGQASYPQDTEHLLRSMEISEKTIKMPEFLKTSDLREKPIPKLSVSTNPTIPTVFDMNEGGSGKKPVSSPSMSPSSRKGYTSINQFIVLTFPERPKPTGKFFYRKKGPTAPYLKERFVHANFRFLIRNAQDYLGTLLDPDLAVDWKDIEQVLVTVSSEDMMSCPICLMRPMAARMTKCGHIFCWSCILHYLHLGERKWRRCPVCYESVYAADLRSLRFAKLFPVEEGLPICMKLMQRPKTSTVVTPFRFDPITHWRGIPSELESVAYIYSKFLVSDVGRMREHLQHERVELAIQMQLANTCNEVEELPFIDMALAQWNVR